MKDNVTRGRFKTPVNAIEVGMEWGRDGFSCGQFRDPPGQVWPDFVHKADEVVTVLKGRLEVAMDGQTLNLEEGDELFIPGGVRHTVRNVHRKETRWLFGYRKGRS